MKREQIIYSPIDAHIKKCKERGLRPCRVGGALCVFHRWADSSRDILQARALMCDNDIERALHVFKQEGFVPSSFEVITTQETMALVEFPGGHIHKVEPEKVRFLDAGVGEASEADKLFTEGFDLLRRQKEVIEDMQKTLKSCNKGARLL